MSTIPFKCPNCGSGQFRVSVEVKSLEDMFDAPCAQCGTPLTEDEIKKQARKIAEDRLKEAFGGSKTIKIKI